VNFRIWRSADGMRRLQLAGRSGDATPNPHFCCLADSFSVEEDIGCWFSGGRAAVERWASCVEQGQEAS
jgi:hypothetical protein